MYATSTVVLDDARPRRARGLAQTQKEVTRAQDPENGGTEELGSDI